MKKLLNSFKHILNLYLTLSLTLLSCSPALMNLDTAKNQVAKYYESGEYEKEMTEIINNAKGKFSGIAVQKNSAVVFDLDETALDNYEAIKKIGFGYESKWWDEWVQQGAAPANKKVKELYDFLIQWGFKVVFISGKKDTQYNAAFRNLVEVGYSRFDTLIVRNRNDYKIKVAEFKSQKRKELTEKGYTIAGCVGDQDSDCEGEDCGIIVKLPNYLYLVE